MTSLNRPIGDRRVINLVKYDNVEGQRLECPNSIENDPCRHAIVFVVVKDALLDGWIAGLNPAVKPLDRSRTRRVRIPPAEAEEFGERLDGVIPITSPMMMTLPYHLKCQLPSVGAVSSARSSCPLPAGS